MLAPGRNSPFVCLVSYVNSVYCSVRTFRLGLSRNSFVTAVCRVTRCKRRASPLEVVIVVYVFRSDGIYWDVIERETVRFHGLVPSANRPSVPQKYRWYHIADNAYRSTREGEHWRGKDDAKIIHFPSCRRWWSDSQMGSSKWSLEATYASRMKVQRLTLATL